MISAKQSINHLAYLCAENGVMDVIFSPGSRNAPVIISFVESGLFNCYSVTDERVAAFMAIGMSQQSKKPTVICCTSGSAAANYSPGITEAYYQGVPLIVLTADRPVELIDQGIGQSIRQKNMYSNYIKYSGELIQEAVSVETLAQNDRLIQEALHQAVNKKQGPVHINLPFHEPLYDTNDNFRPENVRTFSSPVNKPEELLSDELTGIWKSSKRKLILYGMSDPDPVMDKMLQRLSENDQIILLTETCSNRHVDNAIKTIDRVIMTFEDQSETIRPDLVVSLGGAVISKKIKKLFQDYKPSHHWWVAKAAAQNTFGALSAVIYSDPGHFLNQISALESSNSQAFQNTWIQRNELLRGKHIEFVKGIPFSDLQVYDLILDTVPSGSVLHMANSTPVRYIQLFEQNNNIKYLANRGVSGIDGSTSTALGYSMNSEELNVLITGDLSFFYDSNAFLHKYRDARLRIIIINNSGGGIFRIIPGPPSTPQLEKFFEVKHDFNAEHLAEFNGLDYYKASNVSELKGLLGRFLDPSGNGISILEVFTDNELNPKVLESYFDYMKS